MADSKVTQALIDTPEYKRSGKSHCCSTCKNLWKTELCDNCDVRFECWTQRKQEND